MGASSSKLVQVRRWGCRCREEDLPLSRVWPVRGGGGKGLVGAT